MSELMRVIWARIVNEPYNFQYYEDLYTVCSQALRLGNDKAVTYLVMLAEKCEESIRTGNKNIYELHNLHKQVRKAAAWHHFESFLIYVEWDRKPKAKFYAPRRKVLKQVVDALQMLADNKLDVLAISMPPGTGKTTLALFFLSWLAGREPNAPILTGSHSNSFVRGAYDEILRIIDPNGEYLWGDVFPDIKVSGTNAKDCRIDLDKRQRFETLEFTSIGTGNAGLYRAATLLYCDDLVSGIEVALSKERLDKLWEIYTTDLRQRKIGDHCKELHIATRWSVHDIIGRLQQNYEGNDRAMFIVISAMDEKDESNFDYDYGVGFSTQFYREQREIMDEISWRALYENQPIEREGLLYAEDELQRFYDLPDREPDAIISVCDTKDKGTDYCVLPVAYQYGDMYFIDEFICDNSNLDIIEPRLCNMLIKHNVDMARFESNSAGGVIADNVAKGIKGKARTTIMTKFSTANKETRIIVAAGYVKSHFLFRDKEYCKKNKEYGKAMKMLTGYTVAGKNKNDDVPDAMAMLADFIESIPMSKVEVFKRPF